MSLKSEKAWSSLTLLVVAKALEKGIFFAESFMEERSKGSKGGWLETLSTTFIFHDGVLGLIGLLTQKEERRPG